MEKSATILAQSALFRGLSPEDIQQLAGICSELSLARGQLLFAEGTQASGFYVVVEGQMKIYKSNSEGKEKILHVSGPGESFAEVPVFHGAPYPANAAAIQATRLLCFPRDAFIVAITNHPSLSLNMMGNFAMKLRRFSSQIEDLALKEVPARIASHLLYLSEAQGGDDLVKLRIAKGQLANLLGTTPETLSRVFGRLSEQGMIRIDGKVVHLLDREALAELAG
ncbi:Crp/Fnr family transcriptional regulator [Coraliomargarita parva]|uniref:Crp/Fnr family transcriptional regulator n=1 Tax=Coraliomargarita parva TaxID=3014050 RepID=UPI0022B50BF1|nr:Crp/Fnr family transcriptional regulator [Coraliomargarita parva]